jgi:hypothetical protein
MRKGGGSVGALSPDRRDGAPAAHVSAAVSERTARRRRPFSRPAVATIDRGAPSPDTRGLGAASSTRSKRQAPQNPARFTAWIRSDSERRCTAARASVPPHAEVWSQVQS